MTAAALPGPLDRVAMVRLLEGIEGGLLVKLESVAPLAADRSEEELKHIGYGEPLLVTYWAAGVEKRVVFRTQGPNWFGHERRADRANLVLLAADTYADQPKHIQVIDVGAIGARGAVSIQGASEFYCVTTYAGGQLYAKDFHRIEASGVATELDIARARALAEHLAELHTPVESADPQLYQRALRDLVGSGEGIFGITDNYPDACDVTRATLQSLEHLAVDWRWRLRKSPERLRRTHGDFHPYNVLFRDGTDFTLLDASRGGIGDPADDVAAMSINYLFAGLRKPAAWARGFEPLWRTFFETYLARTRDEGVLEVYAPFFAWRALVLASPVWYPDVEAQVRRGLLRAAERWMSGEHFDPAHVDHALPRLREIVAAA